MLTLIMVLAGSYIYTIFSNKTEKVKKFKLEDYNTFIGKFSSGKVLGATESAQTAKEKAEVFWVEIYGESVKDEKPYEVLFDEENQVWLVGGGLPKDMDGGVACILIKKSDGKVLGVWHGK